ncbi:putative 2-aminoethylphosphonate ABC transporter ATP-binding protein [Kiloniella laminariae]|uniref:2-aminoethylphosphonate ABC transporter ATP-binding protein n=1 Tax=Kiloniella laminariae TaxID=454162 RepID=A0ABT4LRK3_9PROT|nr:putative 2-aminoethylphosphonate ABC transporter ATP-binding protein [Kiloniella laminariae]MCZ4282961.1 putative 2-aminoethylphosphonate ABC transporter ATP-binding protein [Kiloniella laminariae]
MSANTVGSDTGRKPYLTTTDLTKNFGSFTALSDITLEIYEGEFVCFLGPSGCGKTTLLRAIAGLDIQTFGKVTQAGKDVSNLPPSERDFGIVFQSYALFPNLTIRRNIAYGLENRGHSKAEINKRVDELLALVGLASQADKYPAQLSGGQQQRIALARAIATNPGLLLLDEPLSALDAKVRAHLRHEIKELQRTLGVTTVMVTHDQEEALTMADRIVVMNNGVIEQVGTPIEIYRDPATAFVADFIGTMNFIPGEFNGGTKLKMGEVELQCEVQGTGPKGNILVAFRPENMLVQEDATELPNSFEAEIKYMEFMGSFFRVDLMSKSASADAHIKGDFSINMVRRTGVKEGDTIRVSIPKDRLTIYPGASNNG